MNNNYYLVRKDSFEIQCIKRHELSILPNTILKSLLNLDEAYEIVVNDNPCGIDIIQGTNTWSIQTNAFWSPDLREAFDFVQNKKLEAWTLSE